jgi:hypothetical protein
LKLRLKSKSSIGVTVTTCFRICLHLLALE